METILRSFYLLLSMILFFHLCLVESNQLNGSWDPTTGEVVERKQSNNPSTSGTSANNDKFEKIYQTLFATKRFAEDPEFYSDFDGDKFNRQERHLRFGKRFNSRSKYSDVDYGHMRFGRR